MSRNMIYTDAYDLSEMSDAQRGEVGRKVYEMLIADKLIYRMTSGQLEVAYSDWRQGGIFRKELEDVIFKK